MKEVWASMYSPAARPSMQRAAPAKKRRLSAITGTSSSITALRGLPASAASRSAISSPRSSIRSAMRSSARARSPGGVAAQPSKAFFAALTARSTSALVESGASAITSPVAGFTTSSDPPSTGSTASPPMKFLSLVVIFLQSSASVATYPWHTGISRSGAGG